MTDDERWGDVVWRAEKAISRRTGSTTWVVVDDELTLHPEAREFAAHLSNLSPETQRAYMPRVARFLTWCEAGAVNWRTITLGELVRFKHEIESTPTKRGSLPTGKTVNAVMTSVCQFLRFCSSKGLIDVDALRLLSDPRMLRFMPKGYDPGESGQHLRVRTRTLKAAEVEHPPAVITDEIEKAVLGECSSARDRLLISLMVDAGIRIGEALGIRREDMHPLPDSTRLGCHVSGPHVHIKARPNNVNGARAKGGRSRSVPLTQRCVILHADYLIERGGIPRSQANDFLFVNHTGSTVGEPMSYSNAKQIIGRLGERVEAQVRPHMLRHTAATRWVRSGVALDVVQQLLGHASSASTLVYVHASEKDKRDAVERVEAGRSA